MQYHRMGDAYWWPRADFSLTDVHDKHPDRPVIEVVALGAGVIVILARPTRSKTD